MHRGGKAERAEHWGRGVKRPVEPVAAIRAEKQLAVTVRPEARVATLDLALPTLASASGPVRPFRSHGTTTFLSGNVAMRDGALVATGKLGADIDVATGQLCARQCALNLLSRMREVAGSLDEVDRILKLTVFVASTPLFVDQHIVADGASDLFVEVFGHLGEHARSAIGVAALPLDSPVEVEAVIAIRASSDGSDAPRGA